MVAQKYNPASRPLIEWAIGAVSAALLLLLLSFMARQALFHDSTPPALMVRVTDIRQTVHGTVVSVLVENRGDKAASAITVGATRKAEGEESSKEIEFDYLAGHSSRRGEFVFPDKDLRQDMVELEVNGSVEP